VRDEDLEEVTKLYQRAGVEATVASFFEGLPQRLMVTDIAIARAGASTVAELTLFGVPSVFVPLPGGLDGQQSINAEALVAQAGALMIDQAAFDQEALLHHLRKLLEEPAHLREVRAAMKNMARPDAGKEMAELILSQIGEK
jgi:UDP-N-acetylglucosamine:LPS N-acetylglucosamine transferase